MQNGPLYLLLLLFFFLYFSCLEFRVKRVYNKISKNSRVLGTTFLLSMFPLSITRTGRYRARAICTIREVLMEYRSNRQWDSGLNTGTQSRRNLEYIFEGVKYKCFFCFYLIYPDM